METNKTRSYLIYAFGEVFLVVIGILIALQVNNWNEERKMDVQERAYMTQLLEDAREDSVFFASRLQLLNQNRRSWNLVIINDAVNWQDSLQKVITDSAFSFYFRIVHDSFLIQNNPDPFKTINDPVLKEMLRDYQNTHNYVSITIEYLNRIIEQHGVPLQLKYSAQIQKIENGSMTISEASDLFQKQDIQAAMILIISLSDASITQLIPFFEANTRLIKQLEENLTD